MKMTEDICAACGSWLCNKFPDDFPDKFKFCCLCLDVISFLSGINTEHYTIEKFSEHLECCTLCQEMIKKKEKMLALITVK